MNRRLATILLSAFIVAALCAFVVYRLVGMRIAASKPLPATSVVAAAQDIKIGTVLSANDLTTLQVQGQAPKGSILDAKSAIGRGVIANIYAGEPILDNRLAPMGSGGGLAATIQKDAEGKPQQVQVVNLLVTPEQAQVLALASNQTHIQLVLRNPLDTKIDPVQGSAMTNIFQDVAKAPVKTQLSGRVNKPVKPAPQMFSVVVINGAQRTEEKFATPEGKQ